MNLSILRLGLVAAAAPFVVALSGSTPRPARLVLQPASELAIDGTSNLHDWTCTTSGLVADVRVTLPEEPNDALPQSVDVVSIDVPVSGIRCRNEKMNENLARALRAGSHPRITFRATGARTLPVPDAAGRIQTTIRGTLTVAGTTRTIDLPVQAARAASGSLRITGSKPFLMSQFGIDPPTAMMGVLKTGNRVTVRFELVASAAEIASLGAESAAR